MANHSENSDTLAHKMNELSKVKTNSKVEDSSEPSDETVGLKRDMDFVGGLSMVIGLMIGSGIFVSPKGVLRGAGSVGLSLVVWVLGGFVSMMGAISYVELGTMITKSGGEYAYLREAFHPVFGYLFAFINTIMLKPSSAAIISLTCGEYVSAIFFDDGCGTPPELITKLIALAVMVSIAAVNCYSVKAATSIQIIFTVCKLAALAIIILGGFVKLGQGYTDYLQNGFDWIDQPATLGSVALGFYSSMWAYDGWNNLNLCVEELDDPQRNLPRAIFIGIPLVTIVYLLTNISYFTVLSPQALLDSSAVAVSWADEVIPQFSWMIPIFVAMSTFGACNGSLFTSGRLVFVAAREGHMVKSLSYIHAKRFTPAPAIMFTILIALFMLIPSDIETLIDFFSFAAWMFYALVFAGLMWLRYKRPNAVRPFKVPLVCPILALVISIYLVFAPIIDEPQLAYFYAMLFILAGLIFYFPFVHFKYEIPGMAKFNIFWQLFLEVAPPPEYDGLVEDEYNTEGINGISKENTKASIKSKGNDINPVVEDTKENVTESAVQDTQNQNTDSELKASTEL